MTAKDTKTKILDTAEMLFGKNGIASTSLRNIIAEAGVNIAAIHYHFGSKKELITEVFARRIQPLNDARLQLLDELELHAKGDPLGVEKIVHAFLEPVFNIPFAQKKHFERIKCLMGKVHMEPAEVEHLDSLFKNILERFMAAFKKALPNIPPVEIQWRINFMLGVMSMAMFKDHIIQKRMEALYGKTNSEELFSRTVQFISAGFKAPATELTLQKTGIENE